MKYLFGFFFIYFYSVPKAPTEVKAFSSGSNAVTLCWSLPAQTNGEILHYTLNIK